MNNPPYVYSKDLSHRYIFTSSGKRDIDKVVEFTPMSRSDVYNLAFGDLLPNGEIDDNANSNNGDIVKIFATVIDIVQDFTEQNPSYIILFVGSTPLRTLLYKRILKTYYQSISAKFTILGLVDKGDVSLQVPFDAQGNDNYYAFLIKRI